MSARTYLVQFTETHADALPPDRWRRIKASSLEDACVVGLRSEPTVKDLLARRSCWGWVQLTTMLHGNGTPMAVQSFHITAKPNDEAKGPH